MIFDDPKLGRKNSVEIYSNFFHQNLILPTFLEEFTSPIGEGREAYIVRNPNPGVTQLNPDPILIQKIACRNYFVTLLSTVETCILKYNPV